MTVIWEPSYSEDARRWRAIATDLTTREFAARAAEIDQNQRYPVENEALLRSSGIASMFLPRSHGGGGASLEAFGAVVEAIAYGCASTSGIVATLQLGALPVLLAGSDEIKRKYLTFSADGRGKTISFALSERNAGSDPARLETRATRSCCARSSWRRRAGAWMELLRPWVVARPRPVARLLAL